MKRLCFIFLFSLLIPYISTLLNISSKDVTHETKSSNYRQIYIDHDEDEHMVSVEEYLPGIVAAQIDVKYGYEAIRAQAIIARTYIYSQMNNKSYVAESALDMDYMSISDMEEYWGEEAASNYSNICDAVNATSGIVMVYDGQYILPLYHEISAGITREGNMPYIQAAESRKDIKADGYMEIKEWAVKDMLDKINSISGMPDITGDDIPNSIQVIQKENGGYVNCIKIENVIYTGEQIKDALGLPSESFIIENYNNTLRTVTKGIGHGYGMSQYGAYAMSLDGRNAEDILNYYFKNIQIISE